MLAAAFGRSLKTLINEAQMTSTSSEFVMIYCTCPDDQTAAAIATQIVEQGLAGCVNRVPGLTSIYKWEGEMKSGTEVLLLIKTTAERCDELTAELVNIHPYELPEVIAVPITTGHQPYLDWIKDCTQ
jgi:periplasmic divalent cation tolerance protein